MKRTLNEVQVENACNGDVKQLTHKIKAHNDAKDYGSQTASYEKTSSASEHNSSTSDISIIPIQEIEEYYTNLLGCDESVNFDSFHLCDETYSVQKLLSLKTINDQELQDEIALHLKSTEVLSILSK